MKNMICLLNLYYAFSKIWASESWSESLCSSVVTIVVMCTGDAGLFQEFWFFFLLKQDTKMAHVAQLRNNIHNKSALSSYIQMFCSSRSCIEKVSDFSSNILNIEADINSIYPNEHEITTDISVSPITTKTTWRVWQVSRGWSLLHDTWFFL